jgi:hypothetical protein
MAIPIVYNGVSYPTIRAASRATGLTAPAISQAVKEGRLVSRRGHGKAIPVVYNGVSYPTILACSKATGHAPVAIARAIKEGRLVGQRGSPVKVCVGEREFESIDQLATATGMHRDFVAKMLKNNQIEKLERLLAQPREPVPKPVLDPKAERAKTIRQLLKNHLRDVPDSPGSGGYTKAILKPSHERKSAVKPTGSRSSL